MEEKIKFALGYGQNKFNYMIRIHSDYAFTSNYICEVEIKNAVEKIKEHLNNNMNVYEPNNGVKYLDIIFKDLQVQLGKPPKQTDVQEIYIETMKYITDQIDKREFEKKFSNGFNLNQEDKSFIWNN